MALYSGGIPHSTPQEKATSAPVHARNADSGEAEAQSPCSVSGETEAQSPALPSPTGHGLGDLLLSWGDCSIQGCLEGDALIHGGPGDKLETPSWRPPGCIISGMTMNPWVHAPCSVAWDILG